MTAEIQPDAEDDAFPPGSRVAVLLPLPLGAAYDYLVPEDAVLHAGDFVRVPLGPRETVGVVWGAGEGEIEPSRLKPVAGKLQVPALAKALRDCVDWVAGYTLSAPGAVLRMVMSVPEALEPPTPLTVIEAAEPPPAVRETPARKRVLALAREGPPRPQAELAREAAVSTGVVSGLVKAGALRAVQTTPHSAPPRPDPAHAGPTLSADQAAAAATLAENCGEGFSVTLLDGVPGSGKTEVYFDTAAKVLAAGRQVVVLLPEIALSAQWLSRFRNRFGAEPVVWHSELTRAQRREAWRWIAAGEAKVVVGARSALFLPYPDLGLIVVDEEHDGSYKQEDGVVYNARDMAVVRARAGEIPLILASATPSLETMVNVERGRYDRLALPERHGGAALPEVEVVDMRSDGPARGRWLSPRLETALHATFEAGEQAMLFLNRRGYAPLTLCRACGHRLQCPRCTAWLVEHRLTGRLLCHHCDYQARLPAACPECSAEDALVPCGPGVERLAEEIAAYFPGVRAELAASDTVTGPRQAEALVRRMEAGELDLVIGTQIVAKGYHFPHLTLVGVVDADLGLSGGDLRAAERSYQLLYQVAGRAGRAQKPGRVMLQTYMPEHPVMAALASGDRDAFLAAERDSRKAAQMPPFGRLAALIVSGRDAGAVDAAADSLGRTAPRGQGVDVLGPAPAPLSQLRGHHRRRLLLKAGRDVAVQPLLRAWLKRAKVAKKVRVKVDVDPYAFL